MLHRSLVLRYIHTYYFPTVNYMFKVNNRNTRIRCEICSKSIIKTPERCRWHRSDIFIVDFEHISHLVLVFLLLTLSRQMLPGFPFQYFPTIHCSKSSLKLRFTLRPNLPEKKKEQKRLKNLWVVDLV